MNSTRTCKREGRATLRECHGEHGTGHGVPWCAELEPHPPRQTLDTHLSDVTSVASLAQNLGHTRKLDLLILRGRHTHGVRGHAVNAAHTRARLRVAGTTKVRNCGVGAARRVTCAHGAHESEQYVPLCGSGNGEKSTMNPLRIPGVSTLPRLFRVHRSVLAVPVRHAVTVIPDAVGMSRVRVQLPLTVPANRRADLPPVAENRWRALHHPGL